MIRRFLARAVLRRAAVLRERALTLRMWARVEFHGDPDVLGARRAELEAKLLDLRASNAEALAEWLGEG